jgi:hypothetical protein
MEPWWAVDAQNEGAGGGTKWCFRGSILLAADLHHFNEEHDSDPHLNDTD